MDFAYSLLYRSTLCSGYHFFPLMLEDIEALEINQPLRTSYELSFSTIEPLRIAHVY